MNPITMLTGFVPFLKPYELWIELTLVAAAASACIGLVVHTVHVHDAGVAERAVAPLNIAIQKQKTEAATKLAVLEAQLLQVQNQATAAKAKEEDDYETRRHASKAASMVLATAAAAHGGRLRDPNAAGCGRGGESAQAGPAARAASDAGNGAGTGGLLSVQLSDLLRARLRRADEINNVYALCRADNALIRKAVEAAP